MNKQEAVSRQVRGFLVPEFTQVLPNGMTLNGLSDRDVAMIKAGYACGECLAIFEHYTIVCPACGLSRNVTADVVDAPQLWLDHISERFRDEPVDKPPVVNPFAAIQNDPDVEQIKLSQLKKKRKKG